MIRRVAQSMKDIISQAEEQLEWAVEDGFIDEDTARKTAKWIERNFGDLKVQVVRNEPWIIMDDGKALVAHPDSVLREAGAELWRDLEFVDTVYKGPREAGRSMTGWRTSMDEGDLDRGIREDYAGDEFERVSLVVREHADDMRSFASKVEAMADRIEEIGAGWIDGVLGPRAAAGELDEVASGVREVVADIEYVSGDVVSPIVKLADRVMDAPA